MRPVVKLLGAALALGLAASAAEAQVVVSSKIDTEGGVLGNIILSVLNANGIETTDRVQLGATPVVRKALIAEHPHFARAEEVVPAAWGSFGREGPLDPAPFRSPIENYYMTDPISRASETMAKCTEEYVLGRERRTGTHG